MAHDSLDATERFKIPSSDRLHKPRKHARSTHFDQQQETTTWSKGCLKITTVPFSSTKNIRPEWRKQLERLVAEISQMSPEQKDFPENKALVESLKLIEELEHQNASLEQHLRDLQQQ
ncbi:uncharacterized protein CLUP02_15052 [Colletotrichum lupini]|uniref:Uncharacterized protein n=1 Tax=Colletotrichum lupini TaxID=145971 RepID=A0A9Q8T5C9_9PEZI|nr:uncharacterized protein CLUP02_15052 [Colletotrichum lupini]UQC89521.1 hypothetical protein CLUP02_15052 [Colletotrichum lupini]